MARSVPVLLALLVGCSGKGSDTPLTPTGTVTTTDTYTTTGSPGGNPGGTPGGTPTGTVTTIPPTDFCPAWPAATGTVVNAMPGDDLQAAVDGLNSGDTLELQTGTYNLAAPLVITTDGITIRSGSGNRADVVLDGGGTATNIIQVVANDVTLVSMTVTHAFENGVQIVPAGADLSGTQIYDLAVVDNGQYGIYIDGDSNTFFHDNGTIACSHIELTSAGRGDVRNACRTAGIEAQRAMGWTVSDTTATGFWCDLGSAHAAIRFWRGSRDTLIRRSRGDNSRRGIVLGFGDDSIGRPHADLPCGQLVAQHYGGRIENSIAWVGSSALEASASGVTDGIAIESSCNTMVVHNSVNIGELATDGDLIHRYATTSGEVKNNMVHKTVLRLDGSLAGTGNNIENAGDPEWQSVVTGDMHLAPASTIAIDAGDPAILSTVPEDFEGHPRDAYPDAGCDERP